MPGPVRAGGVVLLLLRAANALGRRVRVTAGPPHMHGEALSPAEAEDVLAGAAAADELLSDNTDHREMVGVFY